MLYRLRLPLRGSFGHRRLPLGRRLRSAAWSTGGGGGAAPLEVMIVTWLPSGAWLNAARGRERHRAGRVAAEGGAADVGVKPAAVSASVAEARSMPATLGTGRLDADDDRVSGGGKSITGRLAEAALMVGPDDGRAGHHRRPRASGRQIGMPATPSGVVEVTCSGYSVGLRESPTQTAAASCGM